MQLISQSETLKENLELAVEKAEKEKAEKKKHGKLFSVDWKTWKTFYK